MHAILGITRAGKEGEFSPNDVGLVLLQCMLSWVCVIRPKTVHLARGIEGSSGNTLSEKQRCWPALIQPLQPAGGAWFADGVLTRIGRDP